MTDMPTFDEVLMRYNHPNRFPDEGSSAEVLSEALADLRHAFECRKRAQAELAMREVELTNATKPNRSVRVFCRAAINTVSDILGTEPTTQEADNDQQKAD